MLRSEGMNISDDPWVSEVEEGVVDGDATSSGRVEDGEFCVFDSSSEEVSDGVCASVEWDGIEGGVF